jgi:hypothetical protein
MSALSYYVVGIACERPVTLQSAKLRAGTAEKFIPHVSLKGRFLADDCRVTADLVPCIIRLGTQATPLYGGICRAGQHRRLSVLDGVRARYAGLWAVLRAAPMVRKCSGPLYTIGLHAPGISARVIPSAHDGWVVSAWSSRDGRIQEANINEARFHRDGHFSQTVFVPL